MSTQIIDEMLKILNNKSCPNCGTTDLYEFNKSHLDTQIKFDATCKKCGYKFKTIYQYCGTEER